MTGIEIALPEQNANANTVAEAVAFALGTIQDVSATVNGGVVTVRRAGETELAFEDGTDPIATSFVFEQSVKLWVRNDVIGDTSDHANAYPLGDDGVIAGSLRITDLTIDSARSEEPDIDWYQFQFDTTPVPGDRITVTSTSDIANVNLIVEFYQEDAATRRADLVRSDTSGDWVDINALNAGTTYWLLVKSQGSIPTNYEIAFLLAATQDDTEASTDPYEIEHIHNVSRITGVSLHDATDVDRYLLPSDGGSGQIGVMSYDFSTAVTVELDDEPIAPNSSVRKLLTRADSDGDLAGRFFTIDDAYYVWFLVDGEGSDPGLGGMTAIPVALTTPNAADRIDASTVASTVADEIASVPDYTATAHGNVVTVTRAGEAILDLADSDSAATGFVFEPSITVWVGVPAAAEHVLEVRGQQVRYELLPAMGQANPDGNETQPAAHEIVDFTNLHPIRQQLGEDEHDTEAERWFTFTLEETAPDALGIGIRSIIDLKGTDLNPANVLMMELRDGTGAVRSSAATSAEDPSAVIRLSSLTQIQLTAPNTPLFGSRLSNDATLRLRVTDTAGESTTLILELEADDTNSNSRIDDLATNLGDVLAAEVADTALAGHLKATADGGQLAIIADIRKVASLEILTAEASETHDAAVLGFEEGQRVDAMHEAQPGRYHVRVVGGRTSEVNELGEGEQVHLASYPAFFEIFSTVALRDKLLLSLGGEEVDSKGVNQPLERRDIILGGDGNDRLQGGTSEDWIFGQDGNDVLTGGTDLQAGDLLFGGAGDDIFQIVPDRLPVVPATGRRGDPALADMFIGGEGVDQVLYLGGDQANDDDPNVNPHMVRDFVAIGYDRFLHRHRFTSLVWDTANEQFVGEDIDGDGNNDAFVQLYAFFQIVDVEETVIDTRGGRDIVHADPNYILNGQTWGVTRGDVEARATAFGRLEIRGGAGQDVIYGGASSDTIYGQGQIDFIAGGEGDDRILGGDAGDYLFGNAWSVKPAGLDDVVAGTPDGDPLPVEGDPGDPPPIHHRFTDDLASPLDEQFRNFAGVSLPGEPDPSLADMANAFALEGVYENDGLSRVMQVGDVNGDGFYDYLVGGTGDGDSYVLLGPVKPNSLFRVDTDAEINPETATPDLRIRGDDWSYEVTINSAEELVALSARYRVEGRAELIIDTEALGRPARSMGDILRAQGEPDRQDPGYLPIDDLVFVRHTGDNYVISVIAGSSDLPRDVNDPTSVTRRTITIPDSISLAKTDSSVQVHVLDWTGDGADDVFILGRDMTSSGTAGYLFSGAALDSGNLTETNALFTLLDDTTDRTAQLAQIMTERILSGYTAISASSDLVATAAGDVNGDGFDDLLVGNQRFIKIDSSGQTPLANVGRVYLLLGGSSPVSLADAPYIWEAFGLGGGVYTVGDTNLDGYDDIAFGRSIESDHLHNAAGGLFIVPGGSQYTWAESAQDRTLYHDDLRPGFEQQWQEDVRVEIRRDFRDVPDLSIFHGTLQLSAGDFDGDGRGDLAVGAPLSQYASVPTENPESLEADPRAEHVHVFRGAGEFDGDSSRQIYILSATPHDMSGNVAQPADSIVTGEMPGDEFGHLCFSSGIDIDGDRVDDLLIGAPAAKVTTAVDTTDNPNAGDESAGRVYVVYGSPLEVDHPTTGTTWLTNRDVPGSGIYLVDPPTGQPFRAPGGLYGTGAIAFDEADDVDQFQVHTGNWNWTSAPENGGGRYAAVPEVGRDAVATWPVVADLAPSFQVRVITSVTAELGRHARSYVVFDYRSATDFKFAGFDVWTSQWQIGHRSAGGWVVDAYSIDASGLSNETDYDLRIRVSGSSVELIAGPSDGGIESRAIHDFGTYVHQGDIGLGTDNSLGSFDEFSLTETERWYRFDTLGDGQIGNQLQIRMIDGDTEAISRPAMEYTHSAALGTKLSQTLTRPEIRIADEATFELVGDGTYQLVDPQPDVLIVDGASRKLALIEVDLSAFLPYVETPDDILNVTLALGYSISDADSGTLTVEVLDDESDGQATADDASSSSLRFRQADHTKASYAGTFLAHVHELPEPFDLTQEVRDALASGRTRLTLRITATDGLTNQALNITKLGDPDAANPSRLKITTATRYGAVADVYDIQGRLLAEGHAIADMRSFEAGGFLVRVYDPFEQSEHHLYTAAYMRPDGLDYAMEIAPPKTGDFHAVPDQDEIAGGAGDDHVAGNHYVDRLYGGFGLDAFTAEPLEIRDLWFVSGNAQYDLPDPGTQAAFKDGPDGLGGTDDDRDPRYWPGSTVTGGYGFGLVEVDLVDVPETGQESTEVAGPNDFGVMFHRADPNVPGDLELLIAHQLGLTNERPDGSFQPLRPLRATDMARLVELDASYLGISNDVEGAPGLFGIEGIQYAVNLEYLSLAGNEISDISQFEPGIRLDHEREGELGLRSLRFGDLDFNPLLPGQSQGYPTRELGPLEALGQVRELEFLSIDHLSFIGSFLSNTFSGSELKTLADDPGHPAYIPTSRPLSVDETDRLVYDSGAVNYDVLFRIPITAPGSLEAPLDVRVDLAWEALTEDNDLAIGISDGTTILFARTYDGSGLDLYAADDEGSVYSEHQGAPQRASWVAQSSPFFFELSISPDGFVTLASAGTFAEKHVFDPVLPPHDTEFDVTQGLEVVLLGLSSNEEYAIESLTVQATGDRLSLFTKPTYDLNGLDSLTALRWLSAVDLGLEDVTPLVNMGELEYLYLNDSHISDIRPLAELSSLKWVELKDNIPVLQQEGPGDPVDLAEGLIAHYTFSGDANNQVADEYHGTIHGDTELAPDRFGTANSAYSFDGDDDFIELLGTGTGGLGTGGLELSAITVSAWVKSNDTGGFRAFIANAEGGNGFWGGTKKGRFHFWSTSRDPNAGLVDSQWHQVVGTVTTEPGNRFVTLYVDGVQMGAVVGRDSLYMERNIWVGGQFDGWADYDWNGLIDDIRIYDRALTEEEVATLYNPDHVPEPPPPLLLDTSIDALLGQAIIDNGDVGHAENESAGWTGGANGRAFEGDYRILPRQAGASAAAEYRFTGLMPGEAYDIYVTWPAHESRTYRATYQVVGDPNSAVEFNQRFEPAGPQFGLEGEGPNGNGARTWELFQAGHLADDEGWITVRLTGGPVGDDGLLTGNLVADAVRLERAVLPSLQVLDVSGARLDDAASDYIIPDLQQTRPGGYAPIQDDTSTPLVEGVACDSASSAPMEGITGVKWNDHNGDGVRDSDEPTLAGWTIYLDQNGNGQYDEGVDTKTTTGLGGSYSFTGLAAGTYIVGEVVPDGWEQTYPAAPPPSRIETVPVGNVGNTGEWSGENYGGFGPDRICGTVEYEYNIGKYEVTAGQYCEFLNAVGKTDTFGLYKLNIIEQSGSSGSYTYSVAGDRANHPVNYVSWGDAARFANWLHNGQPTGAQDATTTEDGAYYLNGATTDEQLLAVRREMDWRWAITSEDEWYKAAYHKNDGATGNYFDYPTRNDTTPSNDLTDPDPGNNATFHDGSYTIDPPYYFTEAGAHKNSESPYGTFDQGGNLWEWNEVILSDSDGLRRRGLRGGSAYDSDDNLHASSRRYYGSPTSGNISSIGFRVVSLASPPEGTHAVTLSTGEMKTGIDFGNHRQSVPGTAEIHGTVYDDVNGDGQRDGNEPGLPGWTVFLDENGDWQLDVGEKWVTTGADGGYAFTELQGGTYAVVEQANPGWVITDPPWGYQVSEEIVGELYHPNVLYFEFADVPLPGGNGTLEIEAFADLGNGAGPHSEWLTVGTTEGVVLWNEVFRDDGSDVAPVTTTMELQQSELEQLAADGRIVVTVTPNVNVENSGTSDFHAKLTLSYPRADEGKAHAVHIVPDEVSADNDFGNHLAEVVQGSISGVEFSDLDGNGRRDPGEPGVEGWTVFLDEDGDQLYDGGEPVTVTDAHGNYAFTGLDTGIEYHVVEERDAAWVLTYGGPGAMGEYVVEFETAGESFVGADFGNHRVVETMSAATGGYVDEGLVVSLTASVSTLAELTNEVLHWQVVAVDGQLLQFVDPGDSESASFTPLDDGRFVVTLTVTADQGAYVDTLDVFVRNVAPTVRLGGPYAVDEGGPVSFADVIIDPEDALEEVVWTVYDGEDQVVATSATRDYTFTALDEGEYRVAVSVDDGEIVVTAETMVTAANVSPTVSIGGPYAIFEGETLVLGGSANDPGSGDSLKFSWDIDGDGEFDDAVGEAPALSWAELAVLGIDDGPGAYSIAVHVDDGDGGADTDTTTLNVTNAAPIFDGGISWPGSGQEGEVITFSAMASDPADDVISYEWDFDYDGAAFQADPSVSGGSVENVFADDGTYTVAVRASDGLDSMIATLDITIDNVRPEFTGPVSAPATAVEGQLVGFVAAATDPVDALSYAWDFNYGGEPAGFTVQAISDSVSHSFDNEGTYIVAVRVDDSVPGGQVITTHTVEIANAVPGSIAIAGPNTGSEGVQINLSGAYSDAGTIDSHTYRWEVVANNGQVIALAEGDVSTPGEVPDFSFTPVDEGTYQVRLTVSDGLDEGAALHEIIVSNVAPWNLALAGEDPQSPDEPFVLTGTFSDISGDSHMATIDFGDGTSTPIVVRGSAFTAPHLYSQPGSYVATVRLWDNSGAKSDPQTHTLLVGGLTVDIIDVTPNPRRNFVSEIHIDFGKNVTWPRAHRLAGLSLTRDGVPVSMVFPDQFAEVDPDADPGDTRVWVLKDLADITSDEGIYTLALNASESGIMDGDGNPLFADAAVSWVCDRTAPMVTVTPLATNRTTRTLSGTVDDHHPETKVQVFVLDVTTQFLDAVTRDGTWTLVLDSIGDLDDGEYDVDVKATDHVGNSAFDNTSFELTVDTAAPAVTVDSLETTDTSPALTGTIADDHPPETVRVTVDGRDYTADVMGGRWTLAAGEISPPLLAGTYDVQVTAMDAAGNLATDGTTDELMISIQVGPIADQVAEEGRLFTLTFNDTSHGEPLVYSATLDDSSPLPAWLHFLPESRTFFGVPGPDDLGIMTVMVTATDGAGGSGSDEFVLEAIAVLPEVVGRHIFYNNSALDGNDPAANPADDAAIASDKTALLPGGTGSFANCTSHSRGINGVMIDIDELPCSLTAGDFDFQVNIADSPDTWVAAPAPVSVTVREDAGVDNSDRITIIWADNAIENRWGKVTVLSDANGGNLGLAENDVFCFGNVIGDNTGDAEVNGDDYEIMLSQFGQTGNGLAADLDADGCIDFTDFAILRGHYGSSVLPPTLPAPAPEAPAAAPATVAAPQAAAGAVISSRTSRVTGESLSGSDVDETPISATASKPAVDLLVESSWCQGADSYLRGPQTVVLGSSATTLYRAATAENDLRTLCDDLLAGSNNNPADGLYAPVGVDDPLDILAESSVAMPL